MADVDEIKRDLESFKKSIGGRLDGVQSELRELTKALRELIRIDGDIKRVQDAMARIGRQVDDHEERLRTVEVNGAGTGARLGHAERIIWLVVLFASGVLQYMLLH